MFTPDGEATWTVKSTSTLAPTPIANKRWSPYVAGKQDIPGNDMANTTERRSNEHAGPAKGNRSARSTFGLLLIVWPTLLVGGTLQIDTSFDSASIGPYTIDQNNDEIDFEVLSDGLSYEYWVHFKVSGVAGRTITFNLTNADDVPFLNVSGREAQLVYSYDGDTWLRLTHHSNDGNTYSFTETFSANDIHVATFFPFSVDRMSTAVDQAALSPWATKSVLGASHEGRDIDLLTITNPAIPTAQKKVIYSVGRQHAAETSGSHMLQGLIEFLVSDDPYAAGFRDGYVWYIAPMLNPDGVFRGHSRANAEGNDPNRDWHEDNHDSVEISLVRAHLDSIDATVGVDMFIDWHSQMNDTRWYNFVYSPSGNTFFPVLSDWTDFDAESSGGTSCSVSSCSSRGYTTTRLGLLMLVLEPTPHLTSWTEASLRAEGVNTAFAINEHFGQFTAPLLVDTTLDDSEDSADLRFDGAGPDWLESRQDDPSLLSLDTSNVAGNSTPKAAFAADDTANAYLTQRFGWPQTSPFLVRWDIRVEEILDLDGDPDRTGWMLIGDDDDPTRPGANSDDDERFVYLGFARDGGGGIGETMDLVARDRNDAWSAFTVVASGLTIGQWYEIAVACDLTTDTYDVYVDGVLQGTLTSRNTKASLTHISFAQWDNGAGAFQVDRIGDATAVAPAGEISGITLSKDAAGAITLAWDPSCSASDTDYTIYEGTIGDFASHAPLPGTPCTTAGLTTASFLPSPGSRYYLVVPSSGEREGSYGADSTAATRPASALACRPQLAGGC